MQQSKEIFKYGKGKHSAVCPQSSKREDTLHRFCEHVVTTLSKCLEVARSTRLPLLSSNSWYLQHYYGYNNNNNNNNNMGLWIEKVIWPHILQGCDAIL
jgi:hypothetical protein